MAIVFENNPKKQVLFSGSSSRNKGVRGIAHPSGNRTAILYIDPRIFLVLIAQTK